MNQKLTFLLTIIAMLLLVGCGNSRSNLDKELLSEDIELVEGDDNFFTIDFLESSSWEDIVEISFNRDFETEEDITIDKMIKLFMLNPTNLTIDVNLGEVDYTRIMLKLYILTDKFMSSHADVTDIIFYTEIDLNQSILQLDVMIYRTTDNDLA